MIAALSLGQIVQPDADTTCSWPDCTDTRSSQGYCRKHGMRVERGWEVGCESAWERLAAAALAFADAETDHEFYNATERLKKSAEAWKRTKKGGKS